MANIYDSINQLEREVRELDEFTQLSAAMDKVLSDEAATKIYHEFRDLQMSFQTKMQLGQEPSEDEVKKAQDLQAQMQDNAEITALMEREQQLNKILNDVNDAVTRPIREIYNKANAAE
ncbi:MAG: YlbF family regulator [Aerococcus sp.]|nr:YlbF family regulator [Aerococcus sp.]